MGWEFPGDDRGFSAQEQARDAEDQLLIMELQQQHIIPDAVTDDVEEGTR